MFMTGPATVAVMAISPKPFLVIATSADISPRELAQAKIERDNKACGRLVINPSRTSKSTIQLAAKLITATLCTKAITAKTLTKMRGGDVYLVQKKIAIPRIKPGAMATRPTMSKIMFCWSTLGSTGGAVGSTGAGCSKPK